MSRLTYLTWCLGRFERFKERSFEYFFNSSKKKSFIYSTLHRSVSSKLSNSLIVTPVAIELVGSAIMAHKGEIILATRPQQSAICICIDDFTPYFFTFDFLTAAAFYIIHNRVITSKFIVASIAQIRI
jgi:hypothetical protein